MKEIQVFLEKALQENRLAHSYLLIGKADCDFDLLINWLGEKLVLERENFKRALRFEHLVIQEDSKGKIGIDQIRKIRGFLRLKPLYSFRRIIVIKNAHQMTLEASNAFLKTLEEPQGRAVLILISHRPEKLPKTILSRLVSLRVKSQHKKEGGGKDHDFFKKIEQGKIEELFNLAEELAKKNQGDIKKFLDRWLIFLNQKLKRGDFQEDCKIFLQIKAIQKTKNLLENTYINPRLALESLFLELLIAFKT